MDRKIAGLLGAVATLGTLNATQAAPAPAPIPADPLQANSFADLLEPIPNAKAVLQAIDEQVPVPTVMVMMVVVMMELGKLNVVFRRWRRDLLIDGLQHGLGVRDRLQQIGE